MEAERQRLFFALWPDEALRESVSEALAPLLAGVHGRHIARVNLHVTLVFLGSVDTAQRRCLDAAASRIAVAPCELVLDHLHYLARSRILWLGATTTPPGLASLAEGLAEGQRGCGFVPETRAFRPHMTLVRDAKTRAVPRLVNPLHWAVDEFVLVESRTLTQGPQYTVLRRYPFNLR